MTNKTYTVIKPDARALTTFSRIGVVVAPVVGGWVIKCGELVLGNDSAFHANGGRTWDVFNDAWTHALTMKREWERVEKEALS